MTEPDYIWYDSVGWNAAITRHIQHIAIILLYYKGIVNQAPKSRSTYCECFFTLNTDSLPFQPVDPDQGKVILYTTSLGLIRRTQGDCDYVRKIFHNLMVNVDERNVFMNPRLKKELEERLGGKVMTLPKVFINGELIGVHIYI